MDKYNNTLLNAKSKILKALAHPTRLYIAESLANGERCVCEFVDVIGVDFSTISKHLLILKDAGIVKDRKDGKKVIYSLKVPCIVNFMNCVEDVIKVNISDQRAMFTDK